jgi:hypothetical protein
MKRPLLFSLTVILAFVLYILIWKYSPALMTAEFSKGIKKEEGCSVLVNVQPLWCGMESGAPFTHGTYFEMQDGTALFPNNPYEIRLSKYKPGQWLEIGFTEMKDGVVSLSCTPKSGQPLIPVMVSCIREVKEKNALLDHQPDAFSVNE